MNKDNAILKPWYECISNYDYGEMNSRLKRFEPEKEERWANPSPYLETISKRQLPDSNKQVKRRKIIDRHRPFFRERPNEVFMWTLAEITVATRLALRGKRPFAMRHELYNKTCLPWFIGQRNKGLKDIALVSSMMMAGNSDLLGKWNAACICWYKNGEISRVTVAYDNNVGKLLIDEVLLKGRRFAKPNFPDNGTEFHEALLDIADVAPDEYWQNYFSSAPAVMESKDCVYDKQPNMFYLPKPYFKYMLAVHNSIISGGMGSWNDTPIAGSKEFRIVTTELAYQKCRAMLYAVNNC